jgi:hypothetical protein
MNDLLKSIVEWLGKQRYGMALLLFTCLIALSFLGLYELRTQPAYAEVLKSSAFILVSAFLICAFLFVCTSREKWQKALWLRYALRSVGLAAVVGAAVVAWVGYLRENRAFLLDIVLLGPQEMDTQALNNILHRAPAERFRLHLIDRTDDHMTVAEVLTNAVLVDKNVPNRQNDAATIFLIGTPLPAGDFGITFPDRHLSIYTTAPYTAGTNAGSSVYEYAINRAFCGAMICGSRSTPPPGFHEPKSDYFCLFDHARGSTAMDAQIRDPRLCHVHQVGLESTYGRPLVSEYLKILGFQWLTNVSVGHASKISDPQVSKSLLASSSKPVGRK